MGKAALFGGPVLCAPIQKFNPRVHNLPAEGLAALPCGIRTKQGIMQVEPGESYLCLMLFGLFRNFSHSRPFSIGANYYYLITSRRVLGCCIKKSASIRLKQVEILSFSLVATYFHIGTMNALFLCEK